MISVSALCGYLYCPRKLFLQYVLKLEEPPKESLVLGTVRHNCYDGINKAEEGIVRTIKRGLVFESILAAYKKEHLKILRETVEKNTQQIKNVCLAPEDVFSQTLSYIMFESRQRAINIFDFVRKNNVFGDELWEALTPKIISELSIQSDALGLRGIIDMIEVYPDKRIPVELKTGSMPLSGVWPGHKIQIASYGLLLEEEFKQPINEGYVVYLDANERRHIPFNVFLKDEIKDLIKKVNELKESPKAPQILSNTSKCKSCGLREQCYNTSYINELAKGIAA